jgi:uncharacterized integral membrane protein
MESKQFTAKQLSAALSGVLVLLLITLLTVKEIDAALHWAIFFAALSLPALIAMPILDDIMDKESKATEFNAFSIACFVGPGSFLLCLSAVIFHYSVIGGLTFLAGGVRRLYFIRGRNKHAKQRAGDEAT